jgi:hypothetical protein
MVQQLRGLGLAPGVADGAQGEVRVSAQVPRKSVPDVLALLAQHRVADVSSTPATLEALFPRH